MTWPRVSCPAGVQTKLQYVGYGNFPNVSLSPFTSGTAEFWESSGWRWSGRGGCEFHTDVNCVCSKKQNDLFVMENPTISQVTAKPSFGRLAVLSKLHGAGNLRLHSSHQRSKIEAEEQQQSVLWSKLLMKLLHSVLLRGVQTMQSFLLSAPAIRSVRNLGSVAQLPVAWATHGLDSGCICHHHLRELVYFVLTWI